MPLDPLQPDSEAYLAVLFQQWMQHDATKRLIHELKRQIDARRKQSLSLRFDPGKLQAMVTREYHLTNLLEFVQSGEFLKPTNQQNPKHPDL